MIWVEGEVVPVGAARRGVELVRELVVLTRGIDATDVVAAIDGRPELEGVRAQPASDGATLVVHGLPTRVRVVADGEWVQALLTATGDVAHVAWLTARAAGELATVCARAKTEGRSMRRWGSPSSPPSFARGR